jgi:hypothetical protein
LFAFGGIGADFVVFCEGVRRAAGACPHQEDRMSATLHDAPPQDRVDSPDEATGRRRAGSGLLRELLLQELLRRERRDHREHRTYLPRRRPFAGLRRLVAVVAAGALLLTGIALGRGLDFLPGFGNTLRGPRTERVDPPLLLTMQDLAEFRAGRARSSRSSRSKKAVTICPTGSPAARTSSWRWARWTPSSTSAG